MVCLATRKERCGRFKVLTCVWEAGCRCSISSALPRRSTCMACERYRSYLAYLQRLARSGLFHSRCIGRLDSSSDAEAGAGAGGGGSVAQAYAAPSR
eukprot:2876402-Rhodomonas_salina.2